MDFSPSAAPSYMNGYPIGDMNTSPNASGMPQVPLAFDPSMAISVPPGFIPPPSMPPGPMIAPLQIPNGLPPGPYPYASQTSHKCAFYRCLYDSACYPTTLGGTVDRFNTVRFIQILRRRSDISFPRSESNNQ